MQRCFSKGTPSLARPIRHPPVPNAVLQGIRLPGLLTAPTLVLDEDQARDAAKVNVPKHTKQIFRAFYSSELGGIVRDPSLMSIPLDDRMFLHGHGAFEMCHMAQGYLYLFDYHMKRFLWSAGRAGLALPCSEDEIARKILHTAAAGNKMNGFVRFWLTGGRGNFDLKVKGGKGLALYAVTTVEKPYRDNSQPYGFRAKTSEMPIHDSYYTTMLSNSSLPAILAQLEAEKDGLDMGVLVDEEYYVINAGDRDISIITYEDVLIVPPDTETLTGSIINRIIDLLPENEDRNITIKKVERRLFKVSEAKTAKEVLVTHPMFPVSGLIEWDGIIIADGVPGFNTIALNAMIVNDSEPRENSFVHHEIPYGYMTM